MRNEEQFHNADKFEVLFGEEELNLLQFFFLAFGPEANIGARKQQFIEAIQHNYPDPGSIAAILGKVHSLTDSEFNELFRLLCR
jgi:hypothetical protein